MSDHSGDRFRALLVADLALAGGVAKARDLGMALQRYWEEDGVEFAEELVRLAGLDPSALHPVLDEVDRRIAEAGGDVRAALSRRGGLDRSIHVALGQDGAALTKALTELGAPVKAPLRSVAEDRYVAFEAVGEGGMGLVYLALDTELNRQVAFKMVRPDPAAGAHAERSTPASPTEAQPPSRGTAAAQDFEELKSRFLQEAWVTGGMEHPGIVPVYELGRTAKGIPYYTMRFVRGRRTLAEAIEELRAGPVEERLALLEPFLKLCDTVRYAHAKGVVHRDLKPANVALGEYGEVVLLDWGLAKSEGKQDLTGSLWQKRIEEFRAATNMKTVAGALGTPGYMAPEAALGQFELVDKRSDVYSLGAILFEILTGRLPFLFESFAQCVSQLASEDPPEAGSLDPGIPQSLSDLCARALSRDRTQRPGSAEALAAEVRAWQAQSTLDKEIEGLLRDANAALDGAAEVRGEARLQHVDRAAAALERVATRQANHPTVSRYRTRASALRAEGIRERERASARRVLLRVGGAILVLATVVGFVVAGLLDQRRRDAEQARSEATEALAQVLRLSDAKKVRDLLEEVDDLWPLHPDQAPAMERWLFRAQEVLANRGDHAGTLATLRGRAEPHTAGERESDDAAIAERPAWTFASAEDDWRHEVLADLLESLDRLAVVQKQVRQRHEAARTLRVRSVDAHRKDWEEALEAIAASPKYGNLRIAPQIGLVPLGPDPDSDLFEFAHVESGAIPRRDPRTKRLVLTDDVAIVLVLVPGGSGRMGAQGFAHDAPNHDPQAEDDESPVHAVSLSPFFIAKYECTQAQWEKVTGARPSRYAADDVFGGRQTTMRHPVEQVSWTDCSRWLTRYGLTLPTEAQWEHACRAGTDTPWHSGRDSGSLQGVANVADAFCKANGGPTTWQYTVEVDDGFVVHAPAGSFAPNAFGLHDMHGNVWEWCRDTYEGYTAETATDPVTQGAGARVYRGGSWKYGAAFARSADRSALDPSIRNDNLGVRPARSVASE